MTSSYNYSQSMILSISENENKIYLWDEKVCTTIATFEDTQLKGNFYKLCPVDSLLYPSHFYAFSLNKSLISLFNTTNPQPIFKSSPVEEGIRSMEIEGNLLVLGSIKGNIYLYDISSGNVLGYYQVGFNSIDNILISQKYSCILTVSDDFIKVYTLSNIFSLLNNAGTGLGFSNTNTSNCSSIISEYSQLNNNDNMYSDAFLIDFLPSNPFLVLNGNRKISLFKFPSLTQNLMNIYIEDEIVSVKTSSYNYSSLFISTKEKEVYLLNVNINQLDYVNHSQTKALYNKRNMKMIIKTEEYIISMAVSSTSVILGLSNNEVHVFSIIDYRFLSKYCQLKGNALSLTIVNRPISQYGLNLNSQFQVKEVRKLEKVHNSGMPIVISTGIRPRQLNFEEYISQILNDNDYEDDDDYEDDEEEDENH